MGSSRRRRRVEPTNDWEQIELLCGWPEQRDYELIRPLVLFGSPASERASETSAATERTLQSRVVRFDAEGMESHFGSEHARRKKLPPAVRRLVVDLKAEYPGFNLNEIVNASYVRFGSKPDHKTVRRVLEEEPIPLRFVRRFAPYRDIPERRERRLAVVALHAEGWSAKAIAGYLPAGRSTVYRILGRWAEQGPEGLEDRPHGRPPGVRKVTLKAIEAVRRLQKNPHLGDFRIHAALAQIGIHLSPRTCGRILALNRELYGLEKPKGPAKEKREMPFAARRRHQFWSADIRYIDDHKLGGRAYVISVLENHSRALLATAITRSQDTTAFLSVVYEAVKRYGSPEAIVTDGGGIFRSNRANRGDGRRSPQEALGWLTGVRYREVDLERAFFSTRFTRKLDGLGYATFRRWKFYGEEALAGNEAALWLEPETLTVEHAGELLSRYEVHYSLGSTELSRVGSATLFETSIVVHQPRLFDLAETLGEEGWLKALRLADYAPRRPHTPRPSRNEPSQILRQR